MSKEKKHLFDNQKNVSRLLLVFFVFLALLLVPDLVRERHATFAWEEWPEFYPAFGFVACVLLVLLAKYVLRPLVKREEDYYER